MEPLTLEDERLKRILDIMACKGIENAAAGLSEMIGRRISMSVPRVSVVPISSVPELVGGAESLVVGIYLACEGEIAGHIMLILSYQEALQLADLLLAESEGTTTALDSLARSALAEAGNLTASFFLNAIASVLGRSGRPSPPAVIVDMAGAVLDIMLVSAGELSDDILLLEAIFEGDRRQLQMYFWVLPDLIPLQSLVC